jgi:hypothetical protein
MKITRLITWHWGTLEDREWEFRQTVLLTGDPGGGAATLLDAVRAVLTGAGGEPPRSLPAQALGRQADGSCLRSRATAYAAAVFEPSDGAADAGRAFTAVVGVEASEEQGRAQLLQPPQFFIVRQALTRDHFLRESLRGEAPELVAVNQWYLHLQTELRLGSDALQRHDNAAAYLQHLYGAFTGKAYLPGPEAARAARALVKAMSYRHVASVDELVREEVLDAQDATEDVRRLRTLMQALSRQGAEVQRLQHNTRRLRDIGAVTDEVLDITRRFVADTIAQAQRALAEAQAEARRAAAAIEQSTQRSRQAEERLQALRDEQRGIEARLAAIQAQLSHQGVADTEREQKFLRDSLELYERDFRTHWQTLRNAARTAGTLLLRTSQLLEMDFSATPSLQRVTEPLHAILRRLMQKWRGDLTSNLLTDASVGSELPAFDLEDFDTDLMALDRGLRWGDPSVASVMADALAELGMQRRGLDDERRKLSAELKQLQAGRPPAPVEVQEALALLERESPLSQPRMLAELIEPRPGSKWQNAIEGYMGRDRFSIVVEPGLEAECIRLVHERFPARSAKVVEGSRAVEDTQGMSLQATSVLRELQCSHPVARAYLMAQYGRLRKVKTEEGLSRTAQGLMRSGIGSRGYGMFSCFETDAGLAFGTERRTVRQAACERRLVQLGQEVRELERRLASLKQVTTLFTGLAVQVLAPLTSKVLDVQFQFLNARRTLEALDTSSIDGLDRQRSELSEALAQSRRSYEAELQELGRQAEALRRAREQEEFHGGKLPALEQGSALALRWAGRFAAVAGAVAGERQLMDEAHALAHGDEFSVADLKARCDAAPAQLAGALRQLRGSVHAYLTAAETDDQRFLFADPPRSLDRLEDVLTATLRVRDDAARQLARQEDAGLAGSVTRLNEAQARFHAVFSTGWCLKLRDEVRAGQATLEKLNRELKNQPFGTDSFQLEWDWVPEYRRYYEFFEAVHELSDQLDRDRVPVFESPLLPEAHRATAARIRQLLLAPEPGAAEQALRELADPRNYRRYDIVRSSDSGQIRLSTWGDAAEGELAVPLYAVRAAVLAQALGQHGRDRRQAPALRLLLCDESLARLDEARALRVLQFLSRQLGWQLVVALPAVASGAFKPEFGKEYSFSKVLSSRNGRTLDVHEAHEKDLDPQALGRLWAEHGRAMQLRAAGLNDLSRRWQASVEDDR